MRHSPKLLSLTGRPSRPAHLEGTAFSARGFRDGFALGRGAMCPSVGGGNRTRLIHLLTKGLSRYLGHADQGRMDTHVPTTRQVFYEDNTRRISPMGRACGAGKRPLSDSWAQIWD